MRSYVLPALQLMLITLTLLVDCMPMRLQEIQEDCQTSSHNTALPQRADTSGVTFSQPPPHKFSPKSTKGATGCLNGLFRGCLGKTSDKKDIAAQKGVALSEASTGLTFPTFATNRLQDRFEVNERDEDSEEMLFYLKVMDRVPMQEIVKNTLPFLNNDPAFGAYLVNRYGNFKTHLALLSNSIRDRSDAVEFLKLEYETEQQQRKGGTYDFRYSPTTGPSVLHGHGQGPA